MLGLALFGAVVAFNRADMLGAGRALRQAPLGLCISIAVHAPQLLLTALAWRCLIPGPRRPSVRTMVGLRWVRESLNSLVPAGAIVGQAIAVHRLAGIGVRPELAGATAVVDMTIEGATQAVVTFAGLLLLMVAYDGHHLESVALVGMGIAVLAAAAMVVVQRRLPGRSIESILARLAPRWSSLKTGWFDEFHGHVLRLHADRATLARAAVCHLTAWTLGAAEISGVLLVLGHPVSLVDGFVVETLTQALRSAAFLVPGALGVQEGAIIAGCGLVGVPPDAALVLALLRRTREVLLGVPGCLAARQWRAARQGPVGVNPQRHGVRPTTIPP